jgi:TetR/AcrR family transcriptional repressor of nem operon
MRYRPEHKQETHRKIVEAAGKEFRTHGFEGVGIAKLMAGLDLTHGGFYAHFADKEALIAESSVAVLDESLDTMLRALQAGGFPALLDYYLSEGHRDLPDAGCMLPTLSAELARHSSAPREAFTAKLIRVFHDIAEYMPGRTPAHKLEKVQVLFAAMVGAMSLARAVSDPAFSASLLRSTREHLLQFIEAAED